MERVPEFERAGKRAGWTLVLLVGAALGLALLHRAAGTPPTREAVMSVLLEAGESGKAVRDVVVSRGYRPIDWGRAVDRELPDPAFARELERRLAERLRVPDGPNASGRQ